MTSVMLDMETVMKALGTFIFFCLDHDKGLDEYQCAELAIHLREGTPFFMKTRGKSFAGIGLFAASDRKERHYAQIIIADYHMGQREKEHFDTELNLLLEQATEGALIL